MQKADGLVGSGVARSGVAKSSVSKSILVIFPGALGDLICLIPALHELARRHPEATLEVMARAELAHFVSGRLGLGRGHSRGHSQRHSIDGRAMMQLFTREIEIKSEAQIYFNSFTHVYSFFAADNEHFRAALDTASGGRASYFSFRPAGAGHVAAGYLREIVTEINPTAGAKTGGGAGAEAGGGAEAVTEGRGAAAAKVGGDAGVATDGEGAAAATSGGEDATEPDSENAAATPTGESVAATSAGEEGSARTGGEAAAELDCSLELYREDLERAQDRLAGLGLEAGRYLLVLPGSGSPAKNWPAENFAALAMALAPRIRSLVILGPAETALEPVFTRNSASHAAGPRADDEAAHRDADAAGHRAADGAAPRGAHEGAHGATEGVAPRVVDGAVPSSGQREVDRTTQSEIRGKVEWGSRGPAVLGNLELAEVAALARLARGFVGNDSGVSHLAAASGAPGLAIFGPTDPARWRPLGRTRVIRCEPLSALTPKEVEDALLEIIGESERR